MLPAPLQHRLVDTVRLRGLSDKTAKVYACASRNFARHHAQSPENLGTEAIRGWLLHLRREGYAAETLKSYRAAVAFLYEHVLHRPEALNDVPKPRAPRRDVVPALTRGEVLRLLKAAADPLDNAFFRLRAGYDARQAGASAHSPRAGHLSAPLATCSLA